MRPLKSDDMVRGQYAGYRQEPDCGPGAPIVRHLLRSAAVRRFVRGMGAVGICAGKYLPSLRLRWWWKLKQPPPKAFSRRRSGSRPGGPNYPALIRPAPPNSAVAVPPARS